MNGPAAQLLALFHGFPGLPPRQSLQRLVYWGVIIIMTVVIGFSAWYVQKLPADLLAEAKHRLGAHPWLQSRVYIDGRNLSLRGEVEPGAGLAEDLASLRDIAGVRQVSNELDVVPRPTPRLVMTWDGEQAGLGGSLSGADLDRVVAGVRAGFPRADIRDRIRIDDRLGHPLWIPRLAAITNGLAQLDRFTLFAWRDRVLVDGVARSMAMIDEIRYRVPAGLDPSVRMTFRLRPAAPDDGASLSLVSGWNGVALRAKAGDRAALESLALGVDRYLVADENAERALVLDEDLESSGWLDPVGDILPLLGRVHDLYLTSGGDGLWLWGRVDDARTLGEILQALEDSGLGTVVQSRLEVNPADSPAEISLFKDRSRAVVSGRLPNPQSLGLLMETLRDGLGVNVVEDFVTLEPNTGFSPWLDRWPVLLPVLPETPFGLSIRGDQALVSGQLPTTEAYRTLMRALESMLPDVTVVDWLTVATDD